MTEEVSFLGKISKTPSNGSTKEPELIPLPQEELDKEDVLISKTIPNENTPENTAVSEETKLPDTLTQNISIPSSAERTGLEPKANPDVIQPANQVSYIRPIRTYKDDVAKSVKSKKTSLIRMIIAEDERRKTEAEIKSPRSKRNIIFISLSAVLLIFGVSGTIYVFNKYRTMNKPIETKEERVSSIILAETQKEIVVTGRSSTSIIQAFATEIKESNIKLDTIKHIFPTEETPKGKNRLSTQRFFFFLDNRIPATLLRSLNPNFMLGVHAFNGNQAFLILTTDYYENSFAGLLAWERSMALDLMPLFGINQNENDSVFERPFVDRVVKNFDSRVLYNELGEIVMMYTFKDKKTIIITTSENTLEEVVRRLNSAGRIKP